MTETNRVMQRRYISPVATAKRTSVLIPGIEISRLERAPEFFASSTDLSRLTWDTSGRPLGERWLPSELTHGVEFDRRRCPYRDGRQGLLMNVSPLGDIGSTWNSVLAMLSDLSAAYLGVLGQDSHTWLSLWELSKVACAIPYCSNENFIVPTELAALFKPSLGLFMVSEWGVSHGVEPSARVTLAHFTEVLAKSATLWFEDSACSGPPRMINDFAANALTTSGDTPRQHLLTLSGPLSVLVYGAACARLELAKWIYSVDVDFILGKNDGAISQALRSVAKSRGLDLPVFDLVTRARTAITGREHQIADVLVDFAEPWLSSFATLQISINGIMVRPQDASLSLTVYDLDHIVRYFWSGWRYRTRHVAGLMEKFAGSESQPAG